ncbi:hypothetical protein [Clostridium aminobutyricum]|uniref:Uncharacterized protein n=1 Tax=Clostridium aminobutyricum TaxID=33953 RepID=A0A939IIX1_CLOAM|nr:hypothetical protein [Clostridium aminobutyricum]MBN7772964.1 hypothetical protein [Clostridium aminobutyricum]
MADFEARKELQKLENELDEDEYEIYKFKVIGRWPYLKITPEEVQERIYVTQGKIDSLKIRLGMFY